MKKLVDTLRFVFLLLPARLYFKVTDRYADKSVVIVSLFNMGLGYVTTPDGVVTPLIEHGSIKKVRQTAYDVRQFAFDLWILKARSHELLQYRDTQRVSADPDHQILASIQRELDERAGYGWKLVA